MQIRPLSWRDEEYRMLDDRIVCLKGDLSPSGDALVHVTCQSFGRRSAVLNVRNLFGSITPTVRFPVGAWGRF